VDRHRQFIAVVALVTLCWVPAAEAAFPGRNGRIVYTHETAGHCSEAGCDAASRIRTIASAGGPWRPLTEGWSPVFSPDGRRVAFHRNNSLFVVPVNGGHATRVTGRAFGAAWSPDGRRFAFTQITHGGGFGLYTRGVRGGRPRLVAAEGAVEAAWSSRGDIAFTRHPGGGGTAQIYVIGADGNGERLLASHGQHPDWSPRGDRVVFIRNGRVHTVGADGQGWRRLTSGPGAISAAWSPDGTRIAFAKDYDLYVMNPDGGSVRRIARSKSYQPNRNSFDNLDWQPLPPR
jgi:Tol biopolymer transport system component